MGIASLIIGIISIIVALIPICGLVALLPALVGLILGIVDVVKKSKTGESKGAGIAGIILTAIVLVLTLIYNVFIIGLAATSEDLTNSSYSSSSIYDSDYYYDY